MNLENVKRKAQSMSRKRGFTLEDVKQKAEEIRNNNNQINLPKPNNSNSAINSLMRLTNNISNATSSNKQINLPKPVSVTQQILLPTPNKSDTETYSKELKRGGRGRNIDKSNSINSVMNLSKKVTDTGNNVANNINNVVKSAIDTVKDMKNIGQNLGIGFISSLPQSSEYISSANKNIANKVSGKVVSKILGFEENALIEDAGRIITEEVSKTNTKEQFNNIVNNEEFKNWRNNKIQENINNSSNIVTKYLSEQVVSIGNNLFNMAVTTVNPVLGTISFMTSAGGAYLEDARNSGMDEDQAMLYSTIMGSVEGLSERVISGNMLERGADLLGVNILTKQGLHKFVSSFGFNIAENTIQEGVTTYIDAGVKSLITEEEVDWGEVSKDALKSAFDGAVSSIILSGASIGLSKCAKISENMKNGKEISQQEIKDAVEEANKNGIPIDSILLESIKEVGENLQQKENLKNTQLEGLQQELNKAQEEYKNTEDTREKEIIQEKINNYQNEIDEIQNSISQSKISGENNVTQPATFSGYTEKEINNLKSNKISIPNSNSDIINFVNNSQKFPGNFKMYLGKVKNSVSNKIKSILNIDVENYNISLKSDAILHSLKNHSNQIKEESRGQIKLTAEDFTNIPKIINEPDSIIQSGITKQGKPVIKFEKNIDGNNIVITYVSDKHNTLELQTMYKFKNNKKIDSSTVSIVENTIDRTSRTNSGMNHINSISQDISIMQENSSQNYVYEQSNNTKIDNLRKDMSKYWDNSEQTKALGKTIEKIVSDKDYNVRLDDTITNTKGESVNAQITTLENGEVEIKINPDSKNIGEFLLMHEVTHAIETDEIKNLIVEHAKKNAEFNESLESLKATYGVDDVTSEVVADISGQLLGNQEYINNLSIEKPNIFKRIYNKIIEIANKITGNSKESLFVKDLKNKWENAYRTQSNNLNETKYHVSSNFSNEIDKTLNNQLPSNNQVKARDYTPQILVDYGIEDLPMLITQKHVKQIIYTKEEAINLGYKISNKDHYHGLGKETLIKVIDSLDNPNEIYKQSDKNYLIITELKDIKNNPIIVPIEINGEGTYNNIRIDENQVLSVYGHENLDRYLIKNGFEKIYEKNRSKLSGEKVQFPDSTNASTINIPQNKKNGNTNIKYSMQENKNNTKYDNAWKEFLTKNYKATGTRTRLEDIRLPVAERKQITPVFDKNITNKYSDIKEESDINEKQEGNGRNLERNISKSEIFKKREQQEKEYREWEKSIIPKRENELTREERRIKDEFRINKNKDIIFINSDNMKGYYGGSSLDDSAKIYIRSDEAKKFGLKRIAFHETMESNIRFATSNTQDIILSTIQDIIKDDTFQNQKVEFWNNQKGEIPSDTAIAKDIICDRFAEINGEELDYKNLLSDEINSRIDLAIEYFNQELEKSSSFNLPINKDFKEQIDDYILGKLKTGNYINVGKTPKVLQDIGLPNNDIILKQSKLRSILQEDNDINSRFHNLPIETVKRIPEAIANPLNVLQSSSNEQSVVVVTDLADKLERPIIVTIEIDYKGKIGKIDFLSNRLTSAYGKNNYDRFMQTEIAKGNLLYDIDEGIIKELPTTRLLLPEGINSYVDTVDNVSTTNNIISQNDKNMQEKLSSIEENKPIAPVSDEIANKQKQRKHYKSIMNSSNVSDEARKVAKQLIGIDTYYPDSNKRQLKRADERIMANTPDNELITLTTKINNGDRVRAEDIAVGERLIQYYSKTGDYQKLQESIQNTAMIGTELGQAVQAMAILNHQTPVGQVSWIQRSVNKMNRSILNKKHLTLDLDTGKVYNRKGKDVTNKVQLFNFTSEMQQKILNSNSKNMDNILEDVYAELGNQVSQDLQGKIDAWRYFAMLGNIKTHGRNVIGNIGMSAVQKVKNKIAGGIEDVVSVFNPKMERSKSLVRISNAETIKYAIKDINNVKDELGLGENKYNPQSRLQNNMRTFKSDIFENTLGRLFEINNNFLEAEDGIGLKYGYVRALSEYMTANKLTASNITENQLVKARKYAIQQAQEATFHQANSLATLINQISKNKLGKAVTDSILPFVKTPLNVAKTGIEYNPVGLAYNSIKGIHDLRMGNITVNQYIDNVSKGLTGTGIALLGYALASIGVLKGSGSDDDREEYNEELGYQAYSITIGNQTYTLDWLAPTAIPLFVGTEAYDLIHNEGNEKNSISSDDNKLINRIIKRGSNLLGAGLSSMNPMTEMSMLSGLASAISSYEQDSNQKMASIWANAEKSYINQFIPTLVGQIAKTGDDYQRKTASTKTGILEKNLDQTKNQIMSKIPGLRQMLPIATDVWGNKIKQSDNVFLRAYENMIAPYNRKSINTTKVDKRINQLYDKTGSRTILPSVIDKTFNIEGQVYRMTNEEYANYSKQYGKTSYKLIKEFTSSKNYNDLSKDEQQKAIEKIYSYAKESNKIDYADKNDLYVETSPFYNTMEELKDNDGSQSDYLEYYVRAIEINGENEAQEKNQLLLSSNYSDITKSIIYKNTTGKKDKVYQTVDINTYLKFKVNVANFKADKNEDGDSIPGSKKEKIINYVYSLSGLNDVQRAILIKSTNSFKFNDYNNEIIDYVNKLKMSYREKIELLEKLDMEVDSNGNVTWK